MLPQFQEEFTRAQGPVFGKAQQADFLSNLNTLTKSATDRLGSELAGRGAQNSGAASEGFAGIERERLGQATDFFKDLPFREEEARLQRLSPFFNAGLSFVGRGPVNTTSTRTGQTTTDQTGTQSVQGPGFLRSLAGEAGGLIGLGLGNPAIGGALGLTSPPRFDFTGNFTTPPTNPAVDPLGGPPTINFAQQRFF